jgi:hypothetical protein
MVTGDDLRGTDRTPTLINHLKQGRDMPGSDVTGHTALSRQWAPAFDTGWAVSVRHGRHGKA